jgi:hypothetical protein
LRQEVIVGLKGSAKADEARMRVQNNILYRSASHAAR